MQPFIVGISGHRDLRSDRIAAYRQPIEAILQDVSRRYGRENVKMLSPLADGADRVAAYAAKECGVGLKVLLPMPQSLYEEDFDEESRREFARWVCVAESVESVALAEGNNLENIAHYGPHRDRQYRAVGTEVVDRSDLMIFLFDGNTTNRAVGGTGDILQYAVQQGKPYKIIDVERGR